MRFFTWVVSLLNDARLLVWRRVLIPFGAGVAWTARWVSAGARHAFVVSGRWVVARGWDIARLLYSAVLRPVYPAVFLALALISGAFLLVRVGGVTYAPTLCLVVSGLLALVLAVPFERLVTGVGANWRSGVVSAHLLPWVVPFLVLLVILVLLQWRPWQPEFKAQLVATETSFQVADDSEVPLRLPALKKVVVPAEGARVSLPALLLDSSRTTVPGLKGKRGVRSLQIEAKGNAAAGLNPHCSLGLNLPTTPPGVDQTATVRLRTRPSRERAPFLAAWNAADDLLRIDSAPVGAIVVEYVGKVELTVRNCHVESSGRVAGIDTTSEDVGDVNQVIVGNLVENRSPVTFTLGGVPAELSSLDLLSSVSERQVVAEFVAATTAVRDPQFRGVTSGKLEVVDDKTMEWKDKADFVPQQVAITGAGQVVRLSLYPNGFHAALRGSTSGVQVDGREELSDSFSVLLKSNAVLAVFAFLAWSIDKVFTYYSLRQ